MEIRMEFPNPREQRKVWQPLNGWWDFRFKEETDYTQKINVPYAYQCELSGINDKTVHDEVWYRREIQLSEEMKKAERVVLKFLACDYQTTVWVNGHYATSHTGGYGAFSADITEYLDPSGLLQLVVRVYDDLSTEVPRGKQDWNVQTSRCWYYQTTGIWQSVWLEGYGADYITSFRITPDVNTTTAEFELELVDGSADRVFASVTTPKGKNYEFAVGVGNSKRVKLHTWYEKHDLVNDSHLWCPERPNLYQVKIMLEKEGKIVDEIDTYFAFRKIHTANGKIYLNDKPVQFRLVLDQGYWRNGGMTAPSHECFKEDILIAKKYGFNGARKHQKVEDPYFYYYADILGFFAWAETPSAYTFCQREIQEIANLQSELIGKMYNHPSVVAYVPFNESWGIKEVLNDPSQQNLARSIYYLCKAMDKTRLVVTNDGWENMGTTDIVGIHDYSRCGVNFVTDYTNVDEAACPAGRRIMVEGEKIGDTPVMLTEFGGISLVSDNGGWGYGGAETSKEKFLARLQTLLENVKQAGMVNWCYTQLTDVEQETNGLLDADHKPKFSDEELENVFNK